MIYSDRANQHRRCMGDNVLLLQKKNKYSIYEHDFGLGGTASGDFNFRNNEWEDTKALLLSMSSFPMLSLSLGLC